MKIFTTLAEIQALPQSEEVGESGLGFGLFLRWDPAIQRTLKRGFSLRLGQSGEAGISVVALLPARDGVSEQERWARSLLEYQRLCGGYGWILEGTALWRGSDGEPLLAAGARAEEVGYPAPRIIGRLSAALERQLRSTLLRKLADTPSPIEPLA